MKGVYCGTMKKIALFLPVLIIMIILFVVFLPEEIEEQPVVETPEEIVEKPQESESPEKIPVAEQTTPEKVDDTEKIVEKPPVETGPKTLLNIEKSEILSFSLKNTAGSFRIDRKDSQWTVNEGKSQRIDFAKLEESLNPFLSITSEKTINHDPTERELLAMGLGDDALILTLKTPKGLMTFSLGNLTDDNKGYYLQLQGSNEVYRISRSAGDAFALELNDIRDRKIDLGDMSGLVSLKIENGQSINIVPYEKYDMFTSEVYSFMLDQPYRALVPVGPEEMSGFLEDLPYTLSIKNFIDSGKPEDFGLGEKARKLILNKKSGERTELLIGNDIDSETVYGKLADEKQIFTLSRKELPFLDATAYDFTHKIPHLIDSEKVISFTVTTDEVAILCDKERYGGRETYLVNGMEAELTDFEYIFQKSVNIPTAGEVSGPIEMNNSLLNLAYQLKDGGSHWTFLDFYPYDPDKLAVSKNGDTPLFYVRAEDMKKALEDIISRADKVFGF